MTSTPWLPHLPFASTPAERASLARQRFFEEGQRPTGLVPEAVLQSWQRCVGQRRSHAEALAVQPVSRIRLDSALRRTRLLRETAQGELQHLERALSQTACTILLIDSQGLAVYASAPGGGGQSALIHAIARPGVDASEQVMGTTAPGLVLRTGRTCSVDVGEHYFDQIAAVRCAAAPIRDIHGGIAGVLDLTVEHVGFGFDAAMLVGLHARGMERALMQTQSRHQTLVELHVHHQLLGAPASGLMGIDEDGCVAWLDEAAERLTGARSQVLGERSDCEAVLGIGLAALLALASRPDPHPLPLPNGLGVWARVRAPAGKAAPPPLEETHMPADPPPASLPLADQERLLIVQTLQACGGNISETARRLGISRGRVYRATEGHGHETKPRRTHVS